MCATNVQLTVTTFIEGWQAVLKWEVYDTMPPLAAVTVCDIRNTLRHFGETAA